MATKTASVVVLMSVLLGLAMVNDASGLRLDITPNNPTESINTSVSFACYLGSEVAEYSDIYSMVVIKDGRQQIALLRASGITFKYDDIRKRFEAVGVLNKDAGQIFLNLTLLMPRVEDSGSYSCGIMYSDANGLPLHKQYAAKLTVKPADKTNRNYLETVVNSLVRRVELLEKSNKDKDQEKEDLVNSFQKEKNDLVKKVNALERKVGYKSVFSAMIKERNARTPLSPSSTIVFDDVIVREGQGYDEKLGTFTAQRKGLHVFHLLMGTWSQTNSFTEVGITVNGVTKSKLQTSNHVVNNVGDQDQTEISLVVILEVGDEVRVEAGGDTTSGEQMLGDLCMFNGYLVMSY